MNDVYKARAWLNRARKIDKEINLLLDVLAQTKARVTSVTQSLDTVTVSGTKDPHKFDRIAELESEIDNKVDEFVAVKADIFRVLSGLSNRNQRMVLIAYYLDMKTWEQIAVDLHYSYEGIMRLRKLGLIEVEYILSTSQKNT